MDNDKYKVLMIDDDEMIATATSEYFNMFGVRTAYVTTYDDAVAFLDAAVPSATLTHLLWVPSYLRTSPFARFVILMSLRSATLRLATMRPVASTVIVTPSGMTRPGVSVRGLQVMSPRKCRAGVGLTPHPELLHPARGPLDRASVGRGGRGGWHQANGWGPPTKGRGK